MPQIKISIYILVPFIWGMASLFAYIVSYQLSVGGYSRQIFYSAGFFIVCLSFFIGNILLRFILKPTEELVERLKRGSVQYDNKLLSVEKNKRTEYRSKFFLDEIGEYREVFGKISAGAKIKALKEKFPDIIFQSREMGYVLEQVLKVAPSNASVLILGQSGVGKELIADAVHANSQRKEQPFIKINCGAISQNLLESELFGHEKGAFTSAVATHKGCFERADKGTLFLDEVGELPLDVQVKLLRVIQHGEFHRVGGQKAFNVDVRIISATNKHLEDMVNIKEFREDLFYRLNVFNIIVPPLNQRRNDIELLASHFAGKAGKQISEKAMVSLKEHHWKGNIRELENKISKAAICSQSDKLEIEDFDQLQAKNKYKSEIAASTYELTQDESDNEKFDLNLRLGQIEIEYITTALKKNNGVQARAAEMLGIKPRSLWNRIKKYNIDVAALK